MFLNIPISIFTIKICLVKWAIKHISLQIRGIGQAKLHLDCYCLHCYENIKSWKKRGKYKMFTNLSLHFTSLYFRIFLREYTRHMHLSQSFYMEISNRNVLSARSIIQAWERPREMKYYSPKVSLSRLVHFIQIRNLSRCLEKSHSTYTSEFTR